MGETEAEGDKEEEGETKTEGETETEGDSETGGGTETEGDSETEGDNSCMSNDTRSKTTLPGNILQYFCQVQLHPQPCLILHHAWSLSTCRPCLL